MESHIVIHLHLEAQHDGQAMGWKSEIRSKGGTDLLAVYRFGAEARHRRRPPVLHRRARPRRPHRHLAHAGHPGSLAGSLVLAAAAAAADSSRGKVRSEVGSWGWESAARMCLEAKQINP